MFIKKLIASSKKRRGEVWATKLQLKNLIMKFNY
jgi:hypothetical protein